MWWWLGACSLAVRGTYTTVMVTSPEPPVALLLLEVAVVLELADVDVVVNDDVVVELTAVVEDEVVDELVGGTYTPASCTANTHSRVPLAPVAGPLAVTSSSSRPLADAEYLSVLAAPEVAAENDVLATKAPALTAVSVALNSHWPERASRSIVTASPAET